MGTAYRNTGGLTIEPNKLPWCKHTSEDANLTNFNGAWARLVLYS